MTKSKEKRMRFSYLGRRFPIKALASDPLSSAYVCNICDTNTKVNFLEHKKGRGTLVTPPHYTDTNHNMITPPR